MKKTHFKSSKFHTIFSVGLSIIFLLVVLYSKDIVLGIIMFFMLIYIGGNGIIHSKKNELTHDSIAEYLLVSCIAIVVLVSAFS